MTKIELKLKIPVLFSLEIELYLLLIDFNSFFTVKAEYDPINLK